MKQVPSVKQHAPVGVGVVVVVQRTQACVPRLSNGGLGHGTANPVAVFGSDPGGHTHAVACQAVPSQTYRAESSSSASNGQHVVVVVPDTHSAHV